MTQQLGTPVAPVGGPGLSLPHTEMTIMHHTPYQALILPLRYLYRDIFSFIMEYTTYVNQQVFYIKKND